MTSQLFAFLASMAIILASTPPPCCRAFAPRSAPRQHRQLQPLGVKFADAFSRGIDSDDELVANDDGGVVPSRRSFFVSAFAAAAAVVAPLEADAAADCFKDCLKSCKLIAPKDPQYCQNNCQEYCDQPDRTDGLSGSVSSTGGEVGILGINTVVKGEDKPPEVKLPGLDFTTGSGRKLLGY